LPELLLKGVLHLLLVLLPLLLLVGEEVVKEVVKARRPI
jgi:hypothetical protein